MSVSMATTFTYLTGVSRTTLPGLRTAVGFLSINEKTVKVKRRQKRLVTAACFKVLGEDFLLENGTARLFLHTFFTFQSEIEFLTAKRKFTPRSKQLRCITPRITVSDINKLSTAKFPARRFNNLQT
jgi:hypothetical protein